MRSTAIKQFESGLADLGIFDRGIRQRHLGCRTQLVGADTPQQYPQMGRL